GTRTCCHPTIAGVLRQHVDVYGQARRHHAEIGIDAPPLLDQVHVSLSIDTWHADRIVWRPQALRERAVQDQCASALWIRGREEQGHWPALGLTEERGLRRGRSIHHSAHVVHPLFQRSNRNAVGHSRAALVETDESRKG